MASFDVAIQTVLANEGGYVNDPADPGGETKFGISKRAYPDEDIANLTLDRAKFLYKRDYWRFDSVADQDVATKLLDMSVNFGRAEAHDLVWNALRKIACKSIDVADPKRLLRALRFECVLHYLSLIVGHPGEAKFEDGWLWRAVQ